jgi:hypothetical protein
LSLISRMPLVIGSSGVASAPLVAGLPLRAILSGRSSRASRSLRCRCCRRWLAAAA